MTGDVIDGPLGQGRPGSPGKRSRQPGDTAALLVPKSQCCSTALRALSRTATGDVGARVVGPGAIQAVGDPGIRQAKGRGLFRPGADHMPCLWPPPWSRPNTLKRPLLQPSLRVALQQGPLLRVALRASESLGAPTPGWASALLSTRSPDRACARNGHAIPETPSFTAAVGPPSSGPGPRLGLGAPLTRSPLRTGLMGKHSLKPLRQPQSGPRAQTPSKPPACAHGGGSCAKRPALRSRRTKRPG